MLNSTQEKWVDIDGYNGLYQVSTEGRVRNARGRIMADFEQNSGYRFTRLRAEVNKPRNHTIHRLVALNFMPIEGAHLLQVNHINGDKSDNRLVNLEWVTNQQNRNHAIESGLWKHNKPTTGKKIGSTSRFRNVTRTNRGMWSAVVSVGGKPKMKKVFKNEEDAARHVNLIIDTLGLEGRQKNIV